METFFSHLGSLIPVAFAVCGACAATVACCKTIFLKAYERDVNFLLDDFGKWIKMLKAEVEDARSALKDVRRNVVDQYALEQSRDALSSQLRAEIIRHQQTAADATRRIVDLEARLAEALGVPADKA